MIVLECKDCKGRIYFNPIASGSAANQATESHCRCVDRDTNKDKKTTNVIHREYATFIPQYLKA